MFGFLKKLFGSQAAPAPTVDAKVAMANSAPYKVPAPAEVTPVPSVAEVKPVAEKKKETEKIENEQPTVAWAGWRKTIKAIVKYFILIFLYIIDLHNYI
jgi:hypothetical protein